MSGASIQTSFWAHYNYFDFLQRQPSVKEQSFGSERQMKCCLKFFIDDYTNEQSIDHHVKAKHIILSWNKIAITKFTLTI